MDKVAQPGSSGREVHVPTDLLASLLMKQSSAPPAGMRDPYRMPTKVYGVMGATTALTFVALATAYQLLFSHPLFA